MNHITAMKLYVIQEDNHQLGLIGCLQVYTCTYKKSYVLSYMVFFNLLKTQLIFQNITSFFLLLACQFLHSHKNSIVFK